jgi:DNA-binding CsgD family transcriptional regulator/tetratricopeptide (TPR) repeat protein
LYFASKIFEQRYAQSHHLLLAIRQHYRVASSQSEAEQRRWLVESERFLDRLTPDDRTQAQSYRADIQARHPGGIAGAVRLLNEIVGFFDQMPPAGRLSAEIATAAAYWWMENLEMAIVYARYAVTTSEAVGSQREKARALNNLGLILLSARNPELAEIFGSLREAVESTGSWRFCHVSHWVPAMFFALKGDAQESQAARKLQLGIHPIGKGEQTRFDSYRRHSLNLINLLERNYGEVIFDFLRTTSSELENDQSYNILIDVAIAYFFSDDVSAAEQSLRNARKIHRTLNPIQSHAVLESHLLEIALLGATGNWIGSRRLLHALSGTTSGLDRAFVALRKFCSGPPFSELLQALEQCRNQPFVGFFATIVNRAVERIVIEKEDHSLSSAELDVLRQLCLGKSNKDIAIARGRSIDTIKRQVSGAFRKLGVENRTRAIIVAKERGIL